MFRLCHCTYLIEQTVSSVSVRFNIVVQLLLIQCLLLFLLLCAGVFEPFLVSSSWCRFVLQSSCQERGLVAFKLLKLPFGGT